ncbi:hypothetical protein ACRRTK_005512 [Alexandromys fortis]
MGEIASFDKAKLKKTETQEKNTLPTKESECSPASGFPPQRSTLPCCASPAPPPPSGHYSPTPNLSGLSHPSSYTKHFVPSKFPPCPPASWVPRPHRVFGWGAVKWLHSPMPTSRPLQPLNRKRGVKFPKSPDWRIPPPHPVFSETPS